MYSIGIPRLPDSRPMSQRHTTAVRTLYIIARSFMRDQTSNPTFTHTYTLQTLPRFFPVGAPGRLSAAANARLIASSRTPLADLPSAASAALALPSAGGVLAPGCPLRGSAMLPRVGRALACSSAEAPPPGARLCALYGAGSPHSAKEAAIVHRGNGGSARQVRQVA